MYNTDDDEITEESLQRKRILDLEEKNYSLRSALAEKEDAIKELQHYVTGHKGQLTDLNRENIKLKAALAEKEKECKEMRGLLRRIYDGYGKNRDISMDSLQEIGFLLAPGKQAL